MEIAMTQPSLPEPIAAYFAAEEHDPDAVARCFTSQGVVRDEGHTHSGRAAIAAWKIAASAKYSYATRPLRAGQEDGRHIVTARVTGNFPGSPVELQFLFRLERGKIASLEITP
jgi:hypothetical protein